MQYSGNDKEMMAVAGAAAVIGARLFIAEGSSRGHD